MQEREFIQQCMSNVLAGKRIDMSDAMRLINTSDDNLEYLLDAADTIRRELNGDRVDVESLVNAKSGNCSENCAFCAQSAWYRTGISRYPLLSVEELVARAHAAKCSGAGSFCIVCAWREPREDEFEHVCSAIRAIRDRVGIDVNCSLGFLNAKRAERLKALGVKRYNHNLESSSSFFSRICTTHTWLDRFNTARLAKEHGLELCSGGIIGMGESVEQRLELAFEASRLAPEEFPLNILIAREGTPLQGMKKPVPVDDILRTIAVFRFIMPRCILKVAGGREVHLADRQGKALLSGANGIITNGYLTVGGNSASHDIEMIRGLGLKV
ncbi:MAG: biotin synthase BioB [Candidatus Nitrosocaldus sp.]|nr:biotin synthase BioB [Candidatus Nitrosocaldus sp.]MDW8275541.1 biotin synthase BioB [Candidatus Nitrosocaldus sp.]